MSYENIFSLAQITGYIAFFAGIIAYLQKNDLRLKLYSALECAIGVVHFWLMGDPTAAATLFLSFLRSLFAMHTCNRWVALFFIAMIICFGFSLAVSWTAIFPVAGSCIMTGAIFLLKGEHMRYAIMLGCFLWLINGILIGSIGSTCQETMVLGANIITIIRLKRANKTLKA